MYIATKVVFFFRNSAKDVLVCHYSGDGGATIDTYFLKLKWYMCHTNAFSSNYISIMEVAVQHTSMMLVYITYYLV